VRSGLVVAAESALIMAYFVQVRGLSHRCNKSTISDRSSQVKFLFVYRPVARYEGIVSSCSILVNEENIMC